MNSNNRYEALGNAKEKGLDKKKLNKSFDSNINIRPKIRRITPTKKSKEKILSKKNSITTEKLNTRNKYLEYKKLSKKRIEFGSISTTNLSNLTYQENPKFDKYYNTIHDLNKKKIIEAYKPKQKNSLNEKLNPFFKTERKEIKIKID